MRIELQQQVPPAGLDALLIPLFEDQDETWTSGLSPAVDGLVRQLRKSGEWKGEVGETLVLYAADWSGAYRVILVGLGRKDEVDRGVLRLAVARGVRCLKRYEVSRLGLVPIRLCEPARLVRAAVEGLVISTFEPGRYRAETNGRSPVDELVLVGWEDQLGSDCLEECARVGKIVGDGINLAREMTHEPGNYMQPKVFAARAETVAAESGLGYEVLTEKELAELSMNSILAVAGGSQEPPRLVLVTHRAGGDSDPPLALIGKGVTFDSGGLSLKPAQSMEDMKADKAGACSVLAAMQAISRLGISRNVVGVIPLVENLPGNWAQRPGDVITSFSGKTIEVINTDAEGRLILADAISYCVSRFQPSVIVDYATLTGACVVALGHERAGFFCNRDDLAQCFLSAAEVAGEKYWRLPLDRGYRKEIESKIADIKNSGSRWGGAVSAAKFLEEFVGETPWCHIDMAGQDYFQDGDANLGPRGFGVSTMIEFVSAWKGERKVDKT